MKIAILGAGNIARSMCRTIRGMKAAGRPVELYAVASRDIDKAVSFAREQGVTRAYGSYEQMLTDPAVELVYVATPHSHHAEHMKLCIEYHKPILCEKSFTANAEQAREVLNLARERGVYVAEAIWTRYMPARRIIDDLIAGGAIGEPKLLTANLAYGVEHKERIADPVLAGGALLDVGVYPINFASMVFGNDIAEMVSTVTKLPTGVDRTENITIRYADGREAHVMASVAFNSDRRCVVYGDKGYLTVDNVNNPGFIEVFDKNDRLHPVQHIDVPEQITGYEYEVEACLRDIPAGALEPAEMPHSETIEIMRQMDALRVQWNMKYPFE
ncbi:MAG: Gfo/Idh/MocA family oxidoreductase [Clostridia bacterium]|nr:Gfo/Idh/MocA family oxidoreductase [Clostridia bacterium]